MAQRGQGQWVTAVRRVDRFLSLFRLESTLARPGIRDPLWTTTPIQPPTRTPFLWTWWLEHPKK